MKHVHKRVDIWTTRTSCISAVHIGKTLASKKLSYWSHLLTNLDHYKYDDWDCVEPQTKTMEKSNPIYTYICIHTHTQRLSTWASHRSQVSRRIWGTLYQGDHTFGNQTQGQWKGNLRTGRADMRHPRPIFLGINCTHLLAPCLSINYCLHYWRRFFALFLLLVLLVVAEKKAETEKQETELTEHGCAKYYCPSRVAVHKGEE